ncbi:MAG: fibronectin type III domain-containing protein [Chloroflexota bacterium]
MIATATGPTTISLTWSQSSSTFATGYEVYRIADGEPDCTLIATQMGRATTHYDDTGLLPVSTYTYYVKSLYENWTSAPSPTSTAITTS